MKICRANFSRAMIFTLLLDPSGEILFFREIEMRGTAIFFPRGGISTDVKYFYGLVLRARVVRE